MHDMTRLCYINWHYHYSR